MTLLLGVAQCGQGPRRPRTAWTSLGLSVVDTEWRTTLQGGQHSWRHRLGYSAAGAALPVLVARKEVGEPSMQKQETGEHGMLGQHAGVHAQEATVRSLADHVGVWQGVLRAFPSWPVAKSSSRFGKWFLSTTSKRTSCCGVDVRLALHVRCWVPCAT